MARRKRFEGEPLAGMPEMLTTAEVARALKVAPSTLCRWRAAGVGPRVFWLGEATPRYREVDVVAWLELVSA
ncbi:helix-turn-helix transcriptional regulator [Cellulomonas aerilata]|uniref:Helix-turn-helix domain-containing protein n=1 Tax=Cellulomonas aerilata TaxID=515326 RepID=A0A512DEV4_9CELL|nr:helix-turn-helix domain-containing protein [Cellulomonas aerilata]GEO34966.1 hypothetical protein CAE01nite_26910 [Cellulomonas aerilata]